MDVDDHGTAPVTKTPPDDAHRTRATGAPAATAGAHLGRASSADTGTMAGADGLAHRLAHLAIGLRASTSLQEVLDRAVHDAVRLVPGADVAAISLVRARRRVTSAAATSAAGRRLDDLQAELGGGPCLDAISARRSTRVDDLASDERWPELSARSGEIGMPSMLCLQLCVGDVDLGALNLLGARARAFSDASEHVGLLVAAHVAVAIDAARERGEMSAGLTRRDVIGQAKGILMERHRLSADRAFDVLAQASQDLNRRVHDIAADVAATGALPERSRARRRRSEGGDGLR